MAKAPAKTATTKAVAKTTNGDANLPDFMQSNKSTRVGNIDSTDLIIPRVKLIQKISPEVDAFDAATPRTFWHTIAEQNLGDELRAVPILLRKSIVLWAPRGDDRKILARSNDCIHWDVGANTKFEVKPKNGPKQVYDTKGSVNESGLAEFGSSVPGESNSAPAASLTYNMMWHLIDFPDISPVIIINTRSAVKAAKALNSKIEMRSGNHYGQVFTIGVTDEEGDEGPYHGYSYTANGYVQDKDLYEKLGAMFEQFQTSTNWRTNEEEDDVGGGGAGAGPGGSSRGGKTGGRGNAF